MLDVVSVGSATEDVFVHVRGKLDGEKFCLIPGSKIDIEKMETFTGGGATNTSVAFSRLGLNAGILSVVGNDEAAHTVEKNLRDEKVSTEFLVKTKGNTQYSVILTGFGKDRIILYYSNHTTLGKTKNNLQKINAKWFYISSLHEKPDFLKKIVAHAKKTKSKIAFNPGQQELELGVSGFKKLFGKIDVLILNKEEALKLTGSADPHRNLEKLSEIAEFVVITAGKDGAFATDGNRIYSAKSFEKIEVLDATGAGDAFGSGFVSGIIKGKGIEEGLRRGTLNANSVIMYLGTKNILLTEKGLKEFEKKHGKVKI